MSDLDSRLKLGPQGPKPQEKAEPEVEEEKAPLADARKGRAKGPARRKPVAPANTESVSAEGQEGNAAARNWQMQKPWTVWEYDGALRQTSSMPEGEASSLTDVSKAVDSPIAGGQADGTNDAKDMHQAKLAVEESLMANKPLTQPEGGALESFHTPGVLEISTPTAEKANPLSKEATPDPSSLLPVLPPLEANTQSQTEEKTLPSTNAGERHGILDKGEAVQLKRREEESDV